MPGTTVAQLEARLNTTVEQLETRVKTLEHYFAVSKLLAQVLGLTAAGLVAACAYLYKAVIDTNNSFSSYRSQVKQATDDEIQRIKTAMRVDTFSQQLTRKTEFEHTFPFTVLHAFVIPIDGFEAIDFILPVVVNDDKHTVTVTVDKKIPGARVGVRVVAIGF